jgi:hypothetical protein
MGGKPAKARTLKAIPKIDLQHGLWCIIGIVVGLGWSALGYGIAALQGKSWNFLQDWAHLQGFFLIALGTWILLIIRSKALFARLRGVTVNGQIHLGLLEDRRVRAAIVLSVGLLGTASLIALGFPERGAILVFMWTTCAVVCFAAAAATLHTIEIIVAVADLPRTEIKVFRYAPARTPELRAVVTYFSSFTLLVTVGYAFALAGTLAPKWNGSSSYVEAVKVFWPIIYVPICSVALIYPHFAVHRLIQREKEKVLQSCQEDMDGFLAKFRDLKTEDIDRTNTLAQLFDRVAATPNYVVDFGIVVRTALPLLLNVVSFFAKAAFSHGQTGGT